MNEEKWQEYYARMGIKPPFPAATNVKDTGHDNPLPDEIEEKASVRSKIIKEAKAIEKASSREGVSEGDIKVDGGNGTAAESPLILGSETVSKVKPGATMASAVVLPFSLLSTKRAWVWILVLVCIVIVGYVLWRLYLKKDEVASFLKEEVKISSGDPVREYLGNY